ncbi:Amino acid permease 6 [Capsicum chinense]|nr:Amino acid permease 6 [Capsicum chinense]
MAPEFQKSTMYVSNELENGDVQKNFDDDGREKRTGTLLTASAHIITAVIGSGVLSLAWAIAQLGWVAGPAVLFAFSFITYFTSTLLADSYRSPGPISGKRNYTYMDVVRSHLGGVKVTLCGVAQYANLVGVTIGYTITASISMVAVRRSNCFHKNGHQASCSIENYPYMIIFAVIQIILSQIPNFHKLSWLSILAAVMSFAYASIGLGLSIAKAAGTIYTSIKSKVMKRASLAGVSTTTLFYVLCGTIGYAAFGNNAPGNFLTGFGFYEPFWLIDFANVCIAIHLIGAYQVFCQPLYGFVEARCNQRWPDSKFITSEYAVQVPCYGAYNVNMFRLVWRTAYVVVTAVIAMIFPFFNDFLGLIGAASFYPLTVYFPIEMHIAQRKIPKYSFTWVWLKILSWTCLIVSLVAAAGSIQGLAADVKHYKPFSTQQ